LADSFPELKKAVNLGRYPSLPRNFSSALSRVIAKLLVVNPRERPSAASLLDTPELCSRMHLDDLAAEVNVVQRQRSLHMMLMKTITVPTEINSVELPKPCYADVRPNSPAAWIVPDQERVAENTAQVQPKQGLATFVPSTNNPNPLTMPVSQQHIQQTHGTLAHRYLRNQQQQLHPPTASVVINQKENTAVQQNIQCDALDIRPLDKAKAGEGIAYQNLNYGSNLGPPIYSRHYRLPQGRNDAPNAPIKMPIQSSVNEDRPAVPCSVTREQGVQINKGGAFSNQPIRYRESQYQCQAPPPMSVEQFVGQVLSNMAGAGIVIPNAAGSVPQIPIPPPQPLTVHVASTISAPSAPSHPPLPHRRPVGPYVARQFVR
jgi:hypothetical protein